MRWGGGNYRHFLSQRSESKGSAVSACDQLPRKDLGDISIELTMGTLAAPMSGLVQCVLFLFLFQL